MSVRLADAALAPALAAVFRPYVRDGGHSSRPDNAAETVVHVRSVHGGGYELEVPGAAPRRFDTPTSLIAALEFALTTAMLGACRAHVQLHAAGAAVGGRAMLALGRSGAGKSSLATCWHRAGHPALGDDVVMVDARGRAHPFKRVYELASGLLEPLGVSPADTCLWEPGSRDAWYDPSSGPGWSAPAPVATVAVARYREGADVSVTPLAGSALLAALLQSRMPTGDRAATGFEALARLAEGARGYVVEFGSAVEAAERLAGLTR